MKFLTRATLKIAVMLMAMTMVLPAVVMAQVLERISLDSNDNQANSESTIPHSTRVVSTDGRFVAFSSDATNLVTNDNNGVSDVFLRDRRLDTTIRISVNKDDGGDASGESHTPSISSSGRFIAFASLVISMCITTVSSFTLYVPSE